MILCDIQNGATMFRGVPIRIFCRDKLKIQLHGEHIIRRVEGSRFHEGTNGLMNGML